MNVFFSFFSPLPQLHVIRVCGKFAQHVPNLSPNNVVTWQRNASLVFRSSADGLSQRFLALLMTRGKVVHTIKCWSYVWKRYHLFTPENCLLKCFSVWTFREFQLEYSRETTSNLWDIPVSVQSFSNFNNLYLMCSLKLYSKRVYLHRKVIIYCGSVLVYASCCQMRLCYCTFKKIWVTIVLFVDICCCIDSLMA